MLFLYDDYRYTEPEIDDVFLKVKTSIFLTPDFILGSRNPTEMAIRGYIYEKRNYISMNGYIYCNDCLNRDYDAQVYLLKIMTKVVLIIICLWRQ